jgi:hypothetical protein
VCWQVNEPRNQVRWTCLAGTLYIPVCVLEIKRSQHFLVSGPKETGVEKTLLSMDIHKRALIFVQRLFLCMSVNIVCRRHWEAAVRLLCEWSLRSFPHGSCMTVCAHMLDSVSLAYAWTVYVSIISIIGSYSFIYSCFFSSIFMLNPLDPLDRAGSGYGQMAGTCECGNEPSGSVKCGISWLAENQLASQEVLCYME